MCLRTYYWYWWLSWQQGGRIGKKHWLFDQCTREYQWLAQRGNCRQLRGEKRAWWRDPNFNWCRFCHRAKSRGLQYCLQYITSGQGTSISITYPTNSSMKGIIISTNTREITLTRRWRDRHQRSIQCIFQVPVCMIKSDNTIHTHEDTTRRRSTAFIAICGVEC